MMPYRSAQVDRQARRMQRKKERPLGAARQSSLFRREERRNFRRLMLTVVITSITFTMLWNWLGIFHK